MIFSASYDPARDAENYLHAIYDAAYLAHGREGMVERLLNMVEIEAIKNILTQKGNRDEASEKITSILSESRGRLDLERKAYELEEALARLGDQVTFQLAALYSHDWPFESIHIDLTTLPICPYDFKAKNIYVHAAPSSQAQLRILSHELNHFMFYEIYSKDLYTKLGREKFELLKESMTIFTNPEQTGKPNEEVLRKLFIEKGVRSISEAVEIGLGYLTRMRISTSAFNTHEK